MSNKILKFGAIGVGAIAIWYYFFNKKSNTIPKTLINPITKPIVIDQPTDEIVDPVNNEPEIVLDVTVDPVLDTAVIDYDQDITKIEIINRVSANYQITQKTYKVIADLKFTNNSNAILNLNSIKGVKATTSDGSKTLGTMEVILPSLDIQPKASIIVNNVILSDMGSNYAYLSSLAILKIKLDVYNESNTVITAENDSIVVADDSVDANEYTLQSSDVKCKFIHENSSKYLNGNYVFDWDILIRNDSPSDFHLNIVKAIKLEYMYGSTYREVVIQPFSFSNLLINSGEETLFKNMIFEVPYYISGTLVNNIGKSLSLQYSDTKIQGATKLTLMS